MSDRPEESEVYAEKGEWRHRFFNLCGLLLLQMTAVPRTFRQQTARKS